MLNNFERKYGSPENVIVCFGDYDQRNMKNLEPVKGKGFENFFVKEDIKYSWLTNIKPAVLAVLVTVN